MRFAELPRVVRAAVGVLLAAPIAFLLLMPAFSLAIVNPARLPPPSAVETRVDAAAPVLSTTVGAPFVFGHLAIACAGSSGGSRPRILREADVGDPSAAIRGATLPSLHGWLATPPDDVADLTSVAGVAGAEGVSIAPCEVGRATVRLTAVRPGDPVLLERDARGAVTKAWFGTRAEVEGRYRASPGRTAFSIALLIAAIAIFVAITWAAARRPSA